MSFSPKYLYVPLLAVLAVLLVRESVGIALAIFSPAPPMTVLGNLEMYQWTAVGILCYGVLRLFAAKNLQWLETFSHELTHTVVALMMMRRIDSFNAGRGKGNVSSSGSSSTGHCFIRLAPYCLPIFTYFFLFLRPLIKTEALWAYDILVGITIAFHAICFKSQTGSHQPDIRRYPLTFSYLFIITALLFNINTILVSFWSSKNVFTAFWYSLTSMWDGISALWH